MFENPRRGRRARNFTKNIPKIVDLKSSSEQLFSENCRWVPLCYELQLSGVRVIHTRHSSGVLNWIVTSECFNLISFRFLSSKIQGIWFYYCLCFLFFLCRNFLTFLSPASSDSTLVAFGYLFASITKASSALIPGLLWSLRCPVAIQAFLSEFFVRMLVSGVTAR